MKVKRYRIVKVILIFWCLFIGIGALVGGSAMLIKPDGSILQMQGMLKYFKVLPLSNILFKDYTFSGIALIFVNGITNLLATTFLLLDKKLGVKLGMIFGITLMLWITIQFIIFPFNLLSTSYFIFGVLQFLTGYICFVYKNQSEFIFNKNDYDNIGTNKKELVVFYSRDGYSKKIAYHIANEIGADILEIISKERTKGLLGFLWCGRFGMHKWTMPIESFNIDVSKYDKVTICSPIWVFDISAPIRSFLKLSKDKIKRVDYVLVHFMMSNFNKVVIRLDNMYGITHDKVTNICCRFGKVLKTSSK